MLLMLLITSHSSFSQASSGRKRQGVYLGGQKGWNIFKARKKYKHIKNKKRRKSLSSKNNTKRKRAKFKRNKRFKSTRKNSAYKRNGKVRLKKTKLGKSGSLYSYNKKKVKKRKGNMPKFKNQLKPRLTIYGGSGLIFTGQDEKLDVNGDLVNVYSNYKVSPHFTLGAMYNHSNKLSFGGDVRAFRIRSNEEVGTDANLDVNTVVLNPYVKYSFVSITRRVSPYVLLGPSFSFTEVSRDGSEVIEELDLEASGEDVGIQKIVFTEEPVSTGWFPLVGVKVGAGADFKISSKLSAFVQADIDFSASRSNQNLLMVFSENKSDYIFYGLSFGVKYNLLQNTSLF